MSRGLYFHDQYARVSHIGGIHRYKRDGDDLAEALQQVKIALAAKDDKPVKFDSGLLSPTSSRDKQNQGKPVNDALLKSIQRKLKAPIVPEVLCRDLDVLLQRFEEKLKASIKLAAKPADGEPETTEVVIPVPEPTDEEKDKVPPPPAIPKINLPDALLIGLNSTWTELAENAEDIYKVNAIEMIPMFISSSSLCRLGERKLPKRLGIVVSNVNVSNT